MKIDADDPLLTAYALGELDQAEREAVEARLEESPEARQSVAEIVHTANMLTHEMANEPLARLTSAQRELIESAAELAPTNVVHVSFWRRPIKAWTFAAACVALAFCVLPLRYAKTTTTPSISSRVRSILGDFGRDSASSPSAPTATYPNGPRGNTPPAARFTMDPATRSELLRPGSQTWTALSTSTAEAQENDVGALALKTQDVANLQQANSPAMPQPVMDPVLMLRYGLLRPGVPTATQPGLNSSQLGTDGSGSEGPTVQGGSEPTVVTASSSLPSVPSRMAPEMMRRYGLGPLRPVLASSEGAAEKLVELQDKSPRSDLYYREDGTMEIWYHPDETQTRGGTASYPAYVENPFRSAMDEPLSTFSIDVDTASYANVRRFLNHGQWPPRDAVRIEEMINYFTYDYPRPRGDHPFSVNIEVAGCFWNTEHRLVRVGLKGREIAQGKRPPSNFVFLIDVSGSMAPPERLPLIKQALRQLVRRMTATDRVAIVVYASSSGTALASTSCAEKEKILAAIDKLTAGGSTNGGEGIQQAYAVASENFIQGGVNRVLLCTDGDFNVGLTDQEQLVRLIQQKARSGVFLTTLGVGTDNYKDALMQKLADKGNGNYHYLDTLEEAQKVLIEQMNANLVTIAKDVKIQVEFNPALVESYRLIGYEKRVLRNQDFRNDRKDAGEIGAGHSVTALYEIVPPGASVASPAAGEKLKYQPNRTISIGRNGEPVTSRALEEQLIRASDNRTPRKLGTTSNAELLTLKLRYKLPDADKSQLLEFIATDEGAGFGSASTDFKFAAAVAEFGMVLKNSEFKGGATLDSVLEIALETKGGDAGGYRAEFLNLVRKAQTLKSQSVWPSDIIKVPSAEELKKGAKIEIIKPDHLPKAPNRILDENRGFE